MVCFSLLCSNVADINLKSPAGFNRFRQPWNEQVGQDARIKTPWTDDDHISVQDSLDGGRICWGIDWLKLAPLLVLGVGFYVWAILNVFRSEG